MRKFAMIFIAVILTFTLVGCIENGVADSQYKVEYVDYDGTVLQTQSFDSGADLSAVTAPTNPVRVGYTFDSWGGVVPSTIEEESVILIAMYTINQYIVEYVDYDGTVLQTEDYNFGDDLSAIPAPVSPLRDGYTFDGWSGEVPVTMGTELITLTATYITNQNSVEYLDYDGTVLQTEFYFFGGDLSSMVVPTPPARVGYSFDGWSKTLPTTMGEESITLTALYSMDQFRISYNLDGGSNNAKNATSYNIEDNSINLLVARKTGSTFIGWYDTSDFSGSVITEITSGSYNNISLYARWEINQYTVEYLDYDGTILQTETYDYGTDLSGVTAPTLSERNGYTFASWSGTVPATMESLNVAITASYTINKYAIRYNLDGGSNNVGNPSSYNIASKTITLLAAKKSGATFLGWYDNASFRGFVVTEITKGSFGNIDLYAKWDMNEYTVEYVDYDGTGLQVTSYDTGADLSGVTAPAVPIRDGYTFDSWSGTVPATMGTSKVTITATYIVTEYTINYDLDGGSNNVDNVSSYNIEDTTITLLDATKEEVTFSGWYDTSDFSGSIVTEIPIGSYGDITLYAKWEMNEYLSINVRVDSSYDPSDPYNLAVGERITISSLGGNHSAALTSRGRLFTWGHNGDGELGSVTGGNQIIPMEITSTFNLAVGETITSVSLGYSFSSAVTSAGRLFVWGDNEYGQLGDGTIASKTFPIDITNQFDLAVGEAIIRVSLGDAHSSAITSEGRVFTWGANHFGQLGDETTINKLVPTEITDQFNLAQGEAISNISLGASHSSAITSEGRIFTWGNNFDGQLGVGTTDDSSKPMDITNQFNLNVGDKIIQVSLGYYNSSAITSDGRIFTWGDNTYGQLGNGTTIDKHVPTEITNQFNLSIGETITNVSSLAYHFSALTSENKLFTWGRNNNANLGDGTSSNKLIPTDITANVNLASGDKIINVSLGYSHSSAVSLEGRLFTWGGNAYFQCGEEPPFGTYSYDISDITYHFNYFSAYEEMYLDYDSELADEFVGYVGYTFDGWYSDSDLTHLYTGTLMPNYPLYALYIKD